MRIDRERTAPARILPTNSIVWARDHGYLVPMVFDWGCGRGYDVAWMNQQGIKAIGYDPFFLPRHDPSRTDFSTIKTITCSFVLNIIEDEGERISLLSQMQHVASADTLVLLSVRGQRKTDVNAAKQQWRTYRDGYITRTQTFQKGYTEEELTALCAGFGDVIEIYSLNDTVCCLFGLY